MGKKTLRFCGALGGLLAPLLLVSCQDSNRVCEPVSADDGTTQELCYEIGEFGRGTLAQETPEPVGENCPQGGKRIDSGFDDNDNGVLDANEVDVSAFICNGEQGATGPAGIAAIAAIYPEQPGEACPEGGARIAYGFDTNSDGVLQPDEATGSRYVCDGLDGNDGRDGGVGPLRLPGVALCGERRLPD